MTFIIDTSNLVKIQSSPTYSRMYSSRMFSQRLNWNISELFMFSIRWRRCRYSICVKLINYVIIIVFRSDIRRWGLALVPAALTPEGRWVGGGYPFKIRDISWRSQPPFWITTTSRSPKLKFSKFLPAAPLVRSIRPYKNLTLFPVTRHIFQNR